MHKKKVYWVVIASGELVGPYTEGKLHELYKQGDLYGWERVLLGAGEWVSLRSFFEREKFNRRNRVEYSPLLNHQFARRKRTDWWEIICTASVLVAGLICMMTGAVSFKESFFTKGVYYGHDSIVSFWLYIFLLGILLSTGCIYIVSIKLYQSWERVKKLLSMYGNVRIPSPRFSMIMLYVPVINIVGMWIALLGFFRYANELASKLAYKKGLLAKECTAIWFIFSIYGLVAVAVATALLFKAMIVAILIFGIAFATFYKEMLHVMHLYEGKERRRKKKRSRAY